MTFLRTLQADVIALMKAAGKGFRSQQNYHFLGTTREKSHPQSKKRIWTLTCVATAVVLVIWYGPLGLPVHANLNTFNARPCDHPVSWLTSDASYAFNQTLQRQSKTLDESVIEYRRRYGMPPPPNFDKWYAFAKERNTLFIDEFDTIYHSILPFWGLSPSTIRSRVTEDLGFDTHTMGIAIRDGAAIHLGNGMGDWQPAATMKQLSQFAQWLPDMYLEFNIHDEPRVSVPHDDLSQLVSEGYAAQARLNSNSTPQNVFSHGGYEDPIPMVSRNRFVDIGRQETWLYSRLSCPPDSPARDINGNSQDNTSAFAIEPLGFVFNQSAASDVCNNPSLHRQLGLFDRPNAFKITSELVPIFSMSHPSSFQDIPVPSPYYYEGISNFDEQTSVAWDLKKGQLYWRGGSTGGASHGGAWRNYQRQRVIGRLTHDDEPPYILQRNQESTCRIGGKDAWEVRKATDSQLDGYFNAHFTFLNDCNEDCDEERMYFELVDRDDQSEAWKHRYLLDMDGHAYSGRFYAFMRSSSVPLKLTFFREWHENVLVPWVHYVPLNKDANEIPELVRFFEQDPAGRDIAKRIGLDGQSWAAKTLRNEDMDVYMFRLMLEYARVQDDQRESMGFLSSVP
ncbi:Lipopolysaccharide-modifying protein [Penicillium angulare]|uniref:Lipopolysaccharide-modifying protein n=1 Tax=Penicillium angulare TaxID=116970 RepID=A0A9W9KCY2_9EURO|nr:Lipopolysaccharide-modifying protein [Penicillium angulare]